MSFFSNLFGSSKPRFNVRDLVLSSSEEKFQQLCQLTSQKKIIIVAWFPESKQQVEDYFSIHNCSHTVILAKDFNHFDKANEEVYFAEHYPLPSAEHQLYEKNHLEVIIVYSALDEALFKAFGGDRLISIMEKMGIQKNEIIENKMVSNSILNAQEKIQKAVDYDQKSRSAEEWFKKNYPQQ